MMARLRDYLWSLRLSLGLVLLASCGVGQADLDRIAGAKVRRIVRDRARARGARVL